MRYFLRIISGIFLLPLFLYASYGTGLWIMGYELGQSPEELAEKLIKNDRPASDCNYLRTIDLLMRPTVAELQARCIRVYARLAKDPSACELLMPSSYGWSCLGSSMDFRLCIVGEGPEKIVRGQGTITTFDECVSGPASIKNYSCCRMARIVLQDENIESCLLFETDPLRDECHYQRAIKSKDIGECALMLNERNRAACNVAVRALNSSQ